MEELEAKEISPFSITDEVIKEHFNEPHDKSEDEQYFNEPSDESEEQYFNEPSDESEEQYFNEPSDESEDEQFSILKETLSEEKKPAMNNTGNEQTLEQCKTEKKSQICTSWEEILTYLAQSLEAEHVPKKKLPPVDNTDQLKKEWAIMGLDTVNLKSSVLKKTKADGSNTGSLKSACARAEINEDPSTSENAKIKEMGIDEISGVTKNQIAFEELKKPYNLSVALNKNNETVNDFIKNNLKDTTDKNSTPMDIQETKDCIHQSLECREEIASEEPKEPYNFSVALNKNNETLNDLIKNNLKDTTVKNSTPIQETKDCIHQSSECGSQKNKLKRVSTNIKTTKPEKSKKGETLNALDSYESNIEIQKSFSEIVQSMDTNMILKSSDNGTPKNTNETAMSEVSSGPSKASNVVLENSGKLEKMEDYKLSKAKQEELTKCLNQLLAAKILKSKVWGKCNKEIALKVLQSFQKSLKLLLPLHCKKLYFFPQGSTFQGLRARLPNEFSVHFRFGRPFCPHKISNVKVDFVKYVDYDFNKHIKNQYKIPVVKYSLNRDKLVLLMPGIEKFVDEDNPNVVTAGKFLKGIYQAIKECCSLVKNDCSRNINKFSHVEVSQQAHGAKLVIHLKKAKPLVVNIIFSIDMSRTVDALNLLNLPPKSSKYYKTKWTQNGAATAYLVPYNDELWWVDFNPLVKYLLNGKGCLRLVLKLLNAHWETRDWSNKGLKQRYILTVVLVQYLFSSKIKQMEHHDLGKHFFNALVFLKQCVNAKILLDFFVPNQNLLCNVSDSQFTQLSEDLEEIILSISKTPSSVKAIL